jgi:hypothetical protein
LASGRLAILAEQVDQLAADLVVVGRLDDSLMLAALQVERRCEK